MSDRPPGPAPVTVIGLGLMGRALASAFLGAGHPTTVWNRTAARAEELSARGAKPAGSAEEAVAASPLVVVCVSDHDAVHAILDPLDARTLRDRVLVNLSSGTSAQARANAVWARERGTVLLDGAIMAAPADMGTARAALLYSGPRPAFDLHAPALASLGAGTHLGEDHGLSSLYEVAVMGMMWGMLNSFLHGAALLRAAGVEAAAFPPVVRGGIATVAEWLPDFARQVDDGSYPAPDATVGTHLAAMEHLVDESESLGVDAGLPRFVQGLAERAVAAGHGGSGYAALVELFRAPSEVRS
ncbi:MULTISPECIES: NAD(P)-dependent oxidoreductase [unclassified Nocardiopsis]|uniref:NAD(P)-dependent oxidoreductase n=1 Tax=unclassified Nocardiopsis TaxID=2649073 RepID=UPI001F1AA682|nr:MULTISPECIES: NAD(P)-binding domain-containing protein [unclassified Nocardiopsis]